MQIRSNQMNKLCTGFFAEEGPGKIGSGGNGVLLLNTTSLFPKQLSINYICGLLLNSC